MATSSRKPSSHRANGRDGRKPRTKPSRAKIRANRENGKLGGRPRKPAPIPKEPLPPRPLAGTEIDGRRVASLARLGATKDTILTALRVPHPYRQNAEFVTAFDDEVAYGAARREIDLLRERRDLATGRSAFGKVSATLAGMRNMGPNWDRVDKDRGGAKLADQQGAIAEAEKLLGRFRK